MATVGVNVKTSPRAVILDNTGKVFVGDHCCCACGPHWLCVWYNGAGSTPIDSRNCGNGHFLVTGGPSGGTMICQNLLAGQCSYDHTFSFPIFFCDNTSNPCGGTVRFQVVVTGTGGATIWTNLIVTISSGDCAGLGCCNQNDIFTFSGLSGDISTGLALTGFSTHVSFKAQSGTCGTCNA